MATVDLIKLPRIMRARWKLLAACSGALALTVAAGHLVLPDKYTAVASVVIDSRGLNHVLGIAGTAVAQSTLIATQSNIVVSERVAQRVVADLALTRDPTLQAQWQAATNGTGDANAWIALRILNKLKVSRAAPDSTVLNIFYSDPNPARAAEFANAFAQAYLTVALDLSVSPSRTTARFFDDRTKSTRESLQAAQRRLSIYQREHGIVSGDEKLDIETAQLNELATALTTSRTRRIDSRSRTQQASGNANTLPDVLQNPVVQALTTEVARAEAKLKELSNSLGVNHPQYRAAKEELAELQSKLAEQSSRVASSLSVGERASSQGEAEILGAMNAQRARVLQLKNRRDQLSIMERDVDNAQKAYDQALQRFSQTTQESQSGLNDATILTRASVPFESSRRSPLLTVPFAAIAGFLLGIVTALTLEHRAPRIRSSRDLSEAFELPILGSVGYASIPRERLLDRRTKPFQIAFHNASRN
ncbi:MAG: Wzz/FepE/Etk N-terminal domain-containing protein [Pseudomonadota bacterium]